VATLPTQISFPHDNNFVSPSPMTKSRTTITPVSTLKSGLRRSAAPLALSVVLAACATSEPIESTDSATSNFAVSSTSNRAAEDYLALATYWGGVYDEDPKNREAALNFGRALRHLDRDAQAVSVLAQSVQQHPEDAAIVAEYGKALTAAGRSVEGAEYLAQANARRGGDWTNLSAEGVALDNLGQHQKALMKYQEALKSSPGNPSILNNLALSRALDGDIKEAETYMREAVGQPAASPQMRLNLALILGLQGQFDEARRYASVDLPPAAVEENMEYIRSMVDKPSPWSELQALGE
jgi:Flp pilus assembly protein TadD